MASTYTLKSHSYDGRYMYLSCTQTRDVSTNTSKISWTLVVTGGASNYYTTGPTTVKINGTTVYYKDRVFWDAYEFPAGKGSVSGTITVTHDNNGNAIIPLSIETNIYNGVLQTSSGTWTLDSNERFATLTSAPNFNDEERPTITYSNPAGTNVTSLQACITLDGSDPNVDASVVVAYRDIPLNGTSYTFTDITANELYMMQYATTGGNSRKVWFKIKTVIGNNTGYSQLEKTFTIANPNPTISPSIVDTDSAIIALTGNNKTLVRYHSDVSIVANASAVKAATLDTVRITCANRTPVNGTIENVDSSTFVFYAKDSRGNETTKIVTPSDGLFSFVNYVKLTCSLANNMPDSDGNMMVEVAGNYFNGSIGNTSNSLTVKYRYKPVGGSYGSWKTIDATKSGNTYYAVAYENGLDYQTAYVFQAYAVDALGELGEVYSTEKTVKATPVFDWGEHDFKFNVPVYDEFNTVIRNGKAAYTGAGTEAIDPDITTEELCFTDHANSPNPGYWFFIKTVFYGDPSTTAARSQIAIPSGARLSVYHRFYSSDGGWSDWRRHLNEDEKYTQTKLLWTNASPSSAFAAQTLSINLRDYTFVMIESNEGPVFCKVGNDAVMFSHNSYYPCRRTVSVNTSGITFGEGLKYTACPGDAVASDKNTHCIPRYIYGVKGAS